MRNKELVLRRIQTLNGRLKQLQQAWNFKNGEEIQNIINEMNELISDLQSIVEREN